MEYPTRSDFHSICSDLLDHSPTYTYIVKVIIQTSCLNQYNNSFSVRICNTTSEICEGEGQICTGIDRGKRSLDYSNDFLNSSDSINGAILPFMSDSERDRRSPGDYIPLHEDTQQFISRGPILAYIKDDTGQGEFTVNSILLDLGTIFISIFMNSKIYDMYFLSLKFMITNLIPILKIQIILMKLLGCEKMKMILKIIPTRTISIIPPL